MVFTDILNGSLPLIRREQLSTTDSFAQEVIARPMRYTTLLALLGIAYLMLARALKPKSSFPTINEHPSWYSFAAVKAYFFNCAELIVEGGKKFPGPFNLNTENGSILMVPPSMIDKLNVESGLDFGLYATRYYCSNYETFRTFRAPPHLMINDAVMKGLTRSLPKFTKDLSIQMKDALERTWGDSKEWREVDIKADILDWVSRLSSRIFLGPKFANNEDWVRISVSFTKDVFIASSIVRMMPWPLKWPVERLLPLCRSVRRDFRVCAKMLAPTLKERRDEIAAAQVEGRKPVLPDDSIEWFRTAAKGRPYQDTDLQVTLQLAAIHTTGDLMTQSVLNLCAYPEYFAPLREEVVTVLRQYGWQKLALTELRLLDSFIKETQRLKPVSMASMHRTAIRDCDLGNGIVIRKDESLAISSQGMWSGDAYEEPEKFDGYRFLKRRQIPGMENRSLLVATSPDHLGFAHGLHACPGRFFAANEIKIAMVHLLMKYDMKITDPKDAKWVTYGAAMVVNPKARILMRKRQPELDIDSLSYE